MDLSIQEIRERLASADDVSFPALLRALESDSRKGVRNAVERESLRRLKQAEERARVDALFAYETEIALKHGADVVVGVDEVGRGPLAGPLAVGAVILPRGIRIAGLNDSKQIPESDRDPIAQEIRDRALGWCVSFIEPSVIDEIGMTAALKRAFSDAVGRIEQAGIRPDIILLDGNPLHFDEREVNIVKGDAKCASIAAASVLAKVERDEHMRRMDEVYPPYGFAQNKGYGTQMHRDAIRAYGLTDIHRRSFCGEFLQSSLF